MNRRKAAGLLSLLLLPLLASCIPEPGSQVSWSPSGRKVGFLSDGRAYIYDLTKGTLQHVPTKMESAAQLAWSPSEAYLAVSTQNVVELIMGESGRYASSTTFTAPSAGRVKDSVLAWSPEQLRLVLLEDLGENGGMQTTEIDVASGTMDTAPGLGYYGPDGRWLFWVNGVAVGHQQDRTVTAREAPDHRILPLSDEDQAVLADNGVELMWLWGNPLCVTQKHADQAKVLCFDPGGRLKTRASFPASVEAGTAYINPSQDLFAVVGDSLTIVDGQGKVKARGKSFWEAVDREVPGRQGGRMSNIAWSPDGGWLAVVVNGRLCLWNWRNDVFRILPAQE